MQTERYTTSFFGLETAYFDKKYILSLWEMCADEIYMKTHVYISALISIEDLVSGKIRRQNFGDNACVAVSIRNPAETVDPDAYWDAYRKVIKMVRDNLNNPDMTIQRQGIDFYYFVKS